jgi:hypothetical protein
MLDASGLQLAFVFPQFGYDCGLVHAAVLFNILPHLDEHRKHVPQSSMAPDSTSRSDSLNPPW